MAVYYEFSIAPNIRDLIQAKTYEKIICSLMNESADIFPGKYEQIVEQAHGECDFVDIVSKQKYDAKILFSNIQCQLLALKGTKCLVDWIESVRQEIEEASQKLMNKEWAAIQSTTLYIEFSSRLQMYIPAVEPRLHGVLAAG